MEQVGHKTRETCRGLLLHLATAARQMSLTHEFFMCTEQTAC